MARGLGSLRWTLMAGCLKEWDAHPQEKDDETYQGEWYMKVKKAITQIAVAAAKRLAEWLI